MPFVELTESALNPGISPVRIYYREVGAGVPLIFLHGGWGYEVYPFTRQIAELSSKFRMIVPDRSGYGRSMRLSETPTDFHRRAARETISLMDSLAIERAVLWGHSDGAVISALIGLTQPERSLGLILEAFHFYRNKPASREFFENMARDPMKFGDRIASVLAADHGEDYWRSLIVNNGRAWLRLADESVTPTHDLYDGNLSRLKVPVTLIHGSRDPRTEPGELDAVRAALGPDEVQVIEGAGHSPHSETSSAVECTRLAREFLEKILA